MKNTTLIIITLVLNISFSQNDNLRNRYGNDILSENPGTDNEKRYQKIPIGETGGEIDYKYVELGKKYSGASFLIPLGIGVLIGDYLYDYIHGIRTIESKRDKVRFKYGKKLDFSFTPTYDLKNKTAGISFTYNFQLSLETI